jgi:hypothetical protein
MNQETITGIIRHGLTFVGGFLIAKGLVDEGTVAEISGGLLAAVGTIWSVVIKIQAAAAGK